MYLFEHIDPVILRMIDEEAVSQTREQYAAKLARLNQGELELRVKRANEEDGPDLNDVALSFFYELATA